MAQYRALVGINYPGPDGEERRAEIGDVIDDFPADKVAENVAAGVIEPVVQVPAPAEAPERTDAVEERG